MVIGVNLSQTMSELLKSRYTTEVSDSVQRLTSGLKINDAADDIGGLITSNSLKTNTSALRQGIENGNEGIALVQISNKALDNQTDILNEIKTKLEFASLDSTSTDGQEAIRVDIVDLLTQFDAIASDTNYNNTYTLQNSDSDTGFSLPITITFDQNSSSSITTEAIQSNTDGLGLSTLKELTSAELADSVAIAQVDVVEDAIESIEDYTNSFNLTLGEIESAVTNLTGIEKTTTASNESIIKADLGKENAILDKFKLLEQSSEYAFVQANAIQSTVLELLSTSLALNDTITAPENKTTDTKEDDIFSTDEKTYEPYKTSFETYQPPSPSTSNSTTSTQTSTTSSDT